jgi:methyl-accepting chemotaxis protein
MLRIEFAGIRSMPRPARLSIGAVAAVAAVALWLLYRTESNAAQVSRETQRIASSGRGINNYTDSIAELGTTNMLAASILGSLRGVNANLSGIEGATLSIDGRTSSIQRSTSSIAGSTGSISTSERSIGSSVGSISGSVGRINTSLAGVNDNAGHILATSLSIQRGVELISRNLATTRSITDEILSETTDIAQRVHVTDHEAACIDNGLNGGPRC